MAVALRSVAVVVGSLTGSEPAGAADGDTLIGHVSTFDSGTAISPPAGWTEIQETVLGVRQAIYWQVRSGTPNLTWSGPAGGSTIVGISAWTGAHATTPVLASNQQGNDDTTNMATGSIDTTGTDGCMLLCLVITFGNTITSPSGMTNMYNDDGGDYDGSYVIQTTGGSVSKTATVSGVTDGVAGIVAIQPAAGAPAAKPKTLLTLGVG